MWLGATKQYISNTWAWYDGSPLSYTSWAPFQPSTSKRLQARKIGNRLPQFSSKNNFSF
jgi:hypothetical protein